MILIIFFATLAAESLAVAAVIFSLAYPNRRIWPPPQRSSWQAYFMGFIFIISGFGNFTLGILDWGAFALAPWIRLTLGVFPWLSGTGFALWAIVILGLVPTFGNESMFIQRGPYRFSRNPQYVGYSAALIGWAVLASSVLTLSTALVAVIAFILAPLTEEPWLLSRYGSVYEAYRQAVPRFFPLKKRSDVAYKH